MKRLLALLLLLSTPLVAEDEYELRFMRFHKAAGKIAVAGRVKVDSVHTLSIQGSVAKEERTDVSATLAGELEILAAGPKGDVSAAKFTLNEWAAKGEEGADGIFKKGDVIEMKRGEKAKKEATVNGAKASEKQTALARAFLPVDGNDSVTLDDMAGPGRKVKAGEQWALNSEAAVRDAAALGIEGIKPADFSGTVRLEKVEDTPAGKVAFVTALLTFKGAGFPLPDVPPTVKVRTMHYESLSEIDLPLDAAALPRRMKNSETTEMAASGEVESPDGDVTVSLSVHRKESRELTLTTAK